MTLTLYKGTDDNFWAPFKAKALIYRYSEQKFISPKLRKNNLYPYVPTPVCCLQDWLKIGQNQLKSRSWFPWNVWLYDNCQSRDEKNMLINSHSINTKCLFSYVIQIRHQKNICSWFSLNYGPRPLQELHCAREKKLPLFC